MPDMQILGAVAFLSVGTYAFRWAGPALPERFTGSSRAQQLVNDAAVLLLAGVMATTAVTQDTGFSGPARVLAVAAAGLLAWRGAPFIVVIALAATVAALCRLAGLS